MFFYLTENRYILLLVKMLVMGKDGLEVPADFILFSPATHRVG